MSNLKTDLLDVRAEIQRRFDSYMRQEGNHNEKHDKISDLISVLEIARQYHHDCLTNNHTEDGG